VNCFFLFIYSQGKIPVKWLAVESLEQRLYTSQSDVLVFVQFVTSSLLLLSLLIIFHDKLSYCQMKKKVTDDRFLPLIVASVVLVLVSVS